MSEETPDLLLDLPLPGQDEPSSRKSTHRNPIAAQPLRTQRRRRRRVLLVVLLAAAATGGYFLPRAGPPVLRPALDLVDFREQRVGQPSEEVALEIRNAGERSLLVLGTALEGPHGVDVEIVDDGCSGAELPPESHCGLILRLTPGAAGSRTAVVVVNAEAPNSPLRVPIVAAGIEPEIGLEPARRSFPTVILGYTGEPVSVRLRNNGSAPLAVERASIEGDAQADFRTRSDGCSGHSIEPDQTCEISLVFSPRAIGDRRASLRVETDAPGDAPRVQLSATGVRPQPLVALDSESLAFSEQLVGTQSAAVTLRVSNRGTGSLTVREIQVVDDEQSFAIDAGDCGTQPLSGDDACELQIRFAPRREGPLNARLSISSNSDEAPVSLSLDGVGVQPRLEISEASLQYGFVPLGDSRSAEIRLRNAGSASTEIGDIRLARQVEISFRLGNQDCAERTLQPSESCTVSVSFETSSEGLHRGELLIEHGETPDLAAVPLTGSGAVGRLRLSTSEVDFGRVAVGSIARQRLSLTNPGTADLTLGRVAFETVAVTDFRMVVNGCTEQPLLEPEGLCAVVIEYSPASAGRHSASISIRHDGSEGPVEVAVRGRGIPGDGDALRVRPEAVDFGEHLVETDSETALVTLTNGGRGRVELGDIALRGLDSERFSIVGGTCPTTPILIAEANCNLAIRFSPPQPRDYTAVLTIENGAMTEAIEVRLSGAGMVPPPPEEQSIDGGL